MRQNYIILIFFLYLVIELKAIRIEYDLENQENEQFLKFEIRFQAQQELKLRFYNNQTDDMEIFSCSNQDKCECNGNIFSNFECLQNNNQFLMKFIKFPYVYGDNIEILETSIEQTLQSSVQTTKLRMLAVQNNVINQIAQQSVAYSDEDLSSQLQLGDQDDLYLKWQIYSNGTFDMAIDYNNKNWIGLGFCPNMSNCDMIYIFIDGQSVRISDTFATGHTIPETDTSNDIRIQSYYINETGYSVRFNRNLNTGDPKDQILIEGKSYQFCIAWSTENSLEGHNKQYNFDIDFINNFIGKISFDEDMNTLYVIHAIVLFIAWGVFADFGIIIGRFFKSINSYLWIHAICFIIVDFSTIIMMILIFVMGIKGGNIKKDGVQGGHNLISIFLTLLVIVEHILGMVVKHHLESNDTENRQKVFKIRVVHVILGTLMYLAAKIDIILGFIKNESSILLILSIIWTVLLIFVRIVLEVYKSKNKFIQSKVVPSQPQILNENQQKLLKLLESNMPTYQIIKELPNIKWVFLNQDIYDVTDYQHPAGNFLIVNVNGKEISRYFNGGFALESIKMKQHNHQRVAIESLKNRYIGKLQIQNATHLNPESPWELVQKIQLSTNIIQFEFTNKDFTINLKQNLKDFGQHFSISLTEFGPKTRIYTKIMCMANPYQQFRNSIIDYCEGKTQQIPVLQYQTTNTIPLIIKIYNFKKALTPQIFNHQGQFWIQGPFSRGLELESKSKCVVFVGGTGILPFLDLLDLLLIKSYYMANPSKQTQIEQFSPQIDQLDNEFELILLASFQNEEEFIGKEWIRKLYSINKDNNLKLFDMKIRYSDGMLDSVIPSFHNRFNEDFIKPFLGDYKKNIFICGPPNLIYSLNQIISQTNQDLTKVLIV